MFLFIIPLGLFCLSIYDVYTNYFPIDWINGSGIGIIFISFISFSVLFYFLIRRQKFSGRNILIWLLITSLSIALTYAFMTKYRTLSIQEYCKKIAIEEGHNEGKKKGYRPGEDTYFVVSELTKQRVQDECLYSYGLLKVRPNGWTFDWLPDNTK